MISEFKGDSNPLSLSNMIANSLKACDVVCDSKSRRKYYNEYYYTGAGYDTETTTIKTQYCYYKGKQTTVIDGFCYPDTDSRFKPDKVYIMPLYSFVYHVQIMINGFYCTFRYIDKAADFLLSLAQQLKYKIIIWIANLNFEFTFLKAYLKDHVTDYFAKSATKPLYITIDDKIVLRECIGLFGKSLDDIAEHYTTTQKLKGDLNYNLIRTPITPLTDDERLYMYNDVAILHELSYIALDRYCKHKRKIPLTNTGVLRQEVREILSKRLYYIYKDNYLLTPYHNENENLQKAFKLFMDWRYKLYSGGLSHSNSVLVGKILDSCYYVDITSAYPFHMLTKRFPSGELIHANKENAKQIFTSTKHFIAKIRFKHIEAKTSHTLISYNKILNISETRDTIFDNGRLYKGDNVIIWCNEIDLKNIKDLYSGSFELLDLWYFTKSRLIDKSIRQLIIKYYADKKRLKAEGKPYHDEKVKINSFYGMYGTKIYDETTILENNIFVTKNNPDFDIKTAFNHIMLNPYVAYWTTSYTRAMLVKYISKYPSIIAQYDTDSLIFAKTINVELAKKMLNEIELENKNTTQYNMELYNDKLLSDLGTWDVTSIDRLKCLGAKRYVYEKNGKISCTIAGLPKKTLNNMFDSNDDIFDFFAPSMYVGISNSNKLSCKYRHDETPITVSLTDYTGETCNVTYRTFCALMEIPFEMNVQNAFIDHCEHMQHVFNYYK